MIYIFAVLLLLAAISAIGLLIKTLENILFYWGNIREDRRPISSAGFAIFNVVGFGFGIWLSYLIYTLWVSVF